MADAAALITSLYRRHADVWTTARGTALSERAWIERFADMLRQEARCSTLDADRTSQPIARYLAGWAVT